MLTFQQISLTINHQTLLQNCTGKIQPGEFLVLTGTSGSGKSLLLQILAGLIMLHILINLNIHSYFSKTLILIQHEHLIKKLTK